MSGAERTDLDEVARTAPLPGDSEFIRPLTLAGRHVRLEPLLMEHHDALVEAVYDGKLWELWYTNVPGPEGMRVEMERRLALWESRSMLPFTVVDKVTSQVVGMTTYMNIDAVNRRMEIGSTWYAQRVQRTALNTEAKLLLLGHAFEGLGCIAVEFRTHFMNYQSRRAIERLGAKFDGVLRNHSIASNGTPRDTCVYSVIASEWLTVRAHLEWQVARPR